MSAVWNRFASLCTKLMSANRKRFCVHYLTYLGSGEKTVFFVIGSFLSCCCWIGSGHFRTRKVICGQEETTCHSALYICTSEEKRSIDKNKYIGYGNSDD